MGKAIFTVFFLLGFIIFTFIKLAAKGIKEAYKAVNEDTEVARQPAKALEHDDKAEEIEIVEIIAGTLSVQKALITDENGMLPQKAKDKWSLGYIAGYSDALLQHTEIEVDATVLVTTTTIVFMAMFGEEQGPAYYRIFVRLLRTGDLELHNGNR